MIRYIDFSGLSNESVTILLGIRTYWGASVSVLSQWNARRVVVELPRESILRTMNSRVFDYSRWTYTGPCRPGAQSAPSLRPDGSEKDECGRRSRRNAAAAESERWALRNFMNYYCSLSLFGKKSYWIIWIPFWQTIVEGIIEKVPKGEQQQSPRGVHSVFLLQIFDLDNFAPLTLMTIRVIHSQDETRPVLGYSILIHLSSVYLLCKLAILVG